MNPPTSTPGQSSGPTIIVGGGGGNGAIPFHTHPATAITGDTEILLPDRLGELTPEIQNCNAHIETGWWAADTGTTNTPASSFWVGQSIWYGIDTVTGNFGRQFAYEIVPPYRTYMRSVNVITWTAWELVLDTYNRAGYRGNTSALSIPNNTSTLVTLTGTADFDAGGLSIASSIVTIGVAGIYDIDAMVQFASGGAGRRRAFVETWTGADPGVGLGTVIAPAESYADTTANTALTPRTRWTLATGAKVRLVAFQVSGGALNLLNNFGFPPQLNLARI
jgi:hypothetical protein